MRALAVIRGAGSVPGWVVRSGGAIRSSGEASGWRTVGAEGDAKWGLAHLTRDVPCLRARREVLDGRPEPPFNELPVELLMSFHTVALRVLVRDVRVLVRDILQIA